MFFHEICDTIYLDFSTNYLIYSQKIYELYLVNFFLPNLSNYIYRFGN